MSQIIENQTSGAEGQAPVQIKKIKREEFEMKKGWQRSIEGYIYVKARLFTVEFSDGEVRRYLCGADTISREFHYLPFWDKGKEAIEDHLNSRLQGFPDEDPDKSHWVILKNQTIPVDGKDVAFYKWYMYESFKVKEL